jgi:hypothetical protein
VVTYYPRSHALVQHVLVAFIAFITTQILARLTAKPRALSLFKLTSKPFQPSTGLSMHDNSEANQNVFQHQLMANINVWRLAV